MSTKIPNADVVARINNVIDRMFVETAAKNYIVARWAFFHQCNIDFCWLSAQAIEKYLKAILLYNGQSTRNHGHNLNNLLRAVLDINPAIDFGALPRPKNLDSDFFWRDETFATFIHRLNKMGDANNRYMLYGYALHGDELNKLDQVIWQLHRHCRPLKQTVSRKALNLPDAQIDWVVTLKKSKSTHQIFGHLEILIQSKKKADSALRSIFLKQNFAFAPKTARGPTTWGFSITNAPLPLVYEKLKNQKATRESREIAFEVFRWAIENIYLSQEDRKEIKNAMVAFKSL